MTTVEENSTASTAADGQAQQQHPVPTQTFHQPQSHQQHYHSQNQDAPKKGFAIPEGLLSSRFNLPLEPENDSVCCYEFEIPFVTPSKLDRIYRMADWSGDSQQTAGSHTSNDVDEGQWSIASFLESGRIGGIGGGSGQQQQQQQMRRNSRSTPFFPTPSNSRSSGKRSTWNNASFASRKPIIRDPSVSVESSWKLIDEIEFSRLSKLSFTPQCDPRCLMSSGSSPPTIDPSFDRLLARQEKHLGILEITPQKDLSLLSDNSLSQLVEEELKNGETKSIIVSSDTVLSILMASTRTVIPWDIFISKHPNFASSDVLILDKREASDIDLIQVNETKAADSAFSTDDSSVGKDTINYPSNLAIEATRVTANLPFLLSANKSSGSLLSEQKSVGTRYVRWDLGDGLVLLVRGQVNVLVGADERNALLRGLLEYDWGRSSMDWRQRLDTQRASVLTGELKNNNAQVTRWLYSTILLDCSLLKVAFISRLSPRDRTRHSVLAIHDIEPYEFSRQMGIDLANGFGIVKSLAIRFLTIGENLSSDRAVIMRDPIKALLRVYLAPVQ